MILTSVHEKSEFYDQSDYDLNHVCKPINTFKLKI